MVQMLISCISEYNFVLSNYSDNEKPTVTALPDNAVVDENDVTLTCGEVTNEANPTYKWYKGGMVQGPITKTWMIGKTKAASGSYQCEVVAAAHTGSSDKSDTVTVTILCEYH